MGLAGLPEICRQMMAHGAAPELPIAVVQDGTIASKSSHRYAAQHARARGTGGSRIPVSHHHW